MTIKNLMVKMNQVCQKNLGKVIYTLFLLTIIESLVAAVFLFPAAKIFSEAQTSPSVIQSKIILFVLIFAAGIVWLTFQFGFAIMLLRMVRNENTNLGFLFMGFRCFNPAGKVVLSFAAIFAVIGIVSRFITKFLFSKIWPAISSAFGSFSSELEAAEQSAVQSADSAAEISSASSVLPFSPEETASIFFESGLFALIFFVLSLIVIIRFVFVFHLHFDNPRLKIKELFAKSFKMMKGNAFRLVGFALRAGGKNLLTAIVFALIVTFLPDGKSGLSILTFLFDLVYFINLYSALVKFYFTVPVMYEEIRNQISESGEQKSGESESKQEEKISLSDSAQIDKNKSI